MDNFQNILNASDIPCEIFYQYLKTLITVYNSIKDFHKFVSEQFHVLKHVKQSMILILLFK